MASSRGIKCFHTRLVHEDEEKGGEGVTLVNSREVVKVRHFLPLFDVEPECTVHSGYDGDQAGGESILSHDGEHEGVVYCVEGLLEVDESNPSLMPVFFSYLQGRLQVEDGVTAAFPLEASAGLIDAVASDDGVHPFRDDGGHHFVSDVEETDGSPICRSEGVAFLKDGGQTA